MGFGSALCLCLSLLLASLLFCYARQIPSYDLNVRKLIHEDDTGPHPHPPPSPPSSDDLNVGKLIHEDYTDSHPRPPPSPPSSDLKEGILFQVDYSGPRTHPPGSPPSSGSDVESEQEPIE